MTVAIAAAPALGAPPAPIYPCRGSRRSQVARTQGRPPRRPQCGRTRSVSGQILLSAMSEHHRTVGARPRRRGRRGGRPCLRLPVRRRGNRALRRWTHGPPSPGVIRATAQYRFDRELPRGDRGDSSGADAPGASGPDLPLSRITALTGRAQAGSPASPTTVRADAERIGGDVHLLSMWGDRLSCVP